MSVIPILMYHSLSEQAAPGFRKFTLKPEIFAAHLAFLQAQGYTTLTVARLAEIRLMHQEHLLPRKPVVLTFDDAFEDFYLSAWPLLQEYNATASLFVATGYLDGVSQWLEALHEGRRAIIRRAQLREIAEAGIDCGSHTHTHVHMDTVDEKKGRQELVISKALLEQILGRPVTTFAYPYGHHDRRARQWVVEAGFSAACAVKNALSHTEDDLHALARITITDQTDVATLAELLSGQRVNLAAPGEALLTKGWRQFRRVCKKFIPAYA